MTSLGEISITQPIKIKNLKYDVLWTLKIMVILGPKGHPLVSFLSLDAISQISLGDK
jgi:hypothetical protein